MSASVSLWFSLSLSVSPPPSPSFPQFVTRTERFVPHSRCPIRLQKLLRTFSDSVEQKIHCCSRFDILMKIDLFSATSRLAAWYNVLTVRCDLAPSYLNSLKMESAGTSEKSVSAYRTAPHGAYGCIMFSLCGRNRMLYIIPMYFGLQTVYLRVFNGVDRESPTVWHLRAAVSFVCGLHCRFL